MFEQGAAIVGRNFVLKRKGDLLYLPCKKEISCKAPPHLANSPYILCKTARFDEASRRLLLHEQEVADVVRDELCLGHVR